MGGPVLDFKVQPYIPNRFVWAFAISLVSLYSVVELKYILLLVTIILILLCLTTQYHVEINLIEKWYKEYVWVLGLKHGEKEKYSTLEYLFINKGKVTQTTGSRVQTTTVTKDEFRGFIKFDGEEKIHILTTTNHEKLVKAMSKIAQSLQSHLIDYSTGQAVQIV
jgi:hypothetical protein